jgi:ABC-type branched-subunit amino acid transport system substrate-binding protein
MKHALKAQAILAASVALGLLVTTGCGSSETADDGKTTLGILGSVTGPAPFLAFEQVRGSELAIEDEPGTEIVIKQADDKGTPEGALKGMQSLLNEGGGVDAVFGPSLTGQAQQVQELVQTVGRPWCLPAVSALNISDPTDQGNWAFQTSIPFAQSAKVIAHDIVNPTARVAVISDTSATGSTMVADMQEVWKEAGLQPPVVVNFDAAATDLSVQAQKLKDAGVDTLVLAVTLAQQIVPILNGLEQVGFTPKEILTGATAQGTFASIASPAQRESVDFVVPFPLVSPQYTEFLDRYKARYGELPTHAGLAMSSYACMKLFTQALAEAGDSGDPSAVRQAIEDTPSIDILGVTVEKPFSEDDHKFWDPESVSWNRFGFNADGSYKLVDTFDRLPAQ